MSYTEDDLLPLSALQHLLFCERQCALIHVAQVWQENVLTSKGRILHERADAPGGESHGDLRSVRGMALRSLRLGLSGKADVVEFVRDPDGVFVPGREGRWLAHPVEYKRGRPKRNDCDAIQLCAQALCLEEMLQLPPISTACLYYGETRHRHEVSLGAALRKTTEAAAARLHQMVADGEIPVVARAPKCRNCSLVDVCMPPARIRSAGDWLASQLDGIASEAASP